MQIPTPQDIKNKRAAVGLTQNELAKRAGVSQPLVARIESGDVDPRVSTLQRILDAFDEAEKEQVQIKDIMHAPVIHAKPDDRVKNVVDLMEKYGVSQIPVIDNGIAVGSISEEMVLHIMSEHKRKDVSDMEISTIMGASFPTVSSETDVGVVSYILERSPAVLVVDLGKVIGVVTKQDIMKLLKS